MPDPKTNPDHSVNNITDPDSDPDFSLGSGEEPSQSWVISGRLLFWRLWGSDKLCV